MRAVTFFLLLVSSLITACTPVKAYQRGTLAKTEMAWQPLVQDSQLQDHIYFSKEASSGGAQAAGGGCGCN